MWYFTKFFLLHKKNGAYTAWKVSIYGPQKTPYLGTFHAVVVAGNKDNVHELFQELSDDLTLRKLGSKEIRKYQKNVENSWN